MANSETEYDTPKTTEDPKPTKLQWKCLDFGWLIFTWPGRFKSAEFITTFLGFVVISSANAFDSEPRYEFYVFVGVFTWIIVLVHMLLGIPHLIEKLPPIITQPFVFFVLCVIAVLTWLISTCLVVSKDRDSSTVQTGAAFGFMSLFLFIFESLYYFVRWRREGSPSRHSTTTSKEMGQTADNHNDGVEDKDPGY